jgi:hypothetical protein
MAMRPNLVTPDPAVLTIVVYGRHPRIAIRGSGESTSLYERVEGNCLWITETGGGATGNRLTALDVNDYILVCPSTLKGDGNNKRRRT